MMRDPTTLTSCPKSFFPHVTEFCNSISSAKPFFISPEPDAQDIVNECTANVSRHILAEGGSEILGWNVWEWHGVMIEAEFHALWKTADGEIRDVTPAPSGTWRRLFLPDPNLRYEGRQINNIRRALIDDVRVAEFISSADKIFEIMNRGERALQHGEIQLTGDEAIEYQKAGRRSAALMLEIERSKPGRNDLCRCGSGTKFKKCCGRWL